MPSINFNQSVVDFGTQISDGIRIGPIKSLDQRGEIIQSKSGIGIPLSPLFTYSGFIAPSVFLDLSDGIELNQNENPFDVKFKQNTLTVNNNMSEDKSIFVMDYPRTIEFQKRAVNTGTACLELNNILVEGEDFYGFPLSETIDLVAIDGLRQQNNIPIGGATTLALSESAKTNGYITDDGYTSTKKAFFKITSISGNNDGVQGRLYVRTGNSIGLPFYTDRTIAYDYYINKNFSSAFNGFQRGLIRSGLSLDEVSYLDTIDVRGLLSVISSNNVNNGDDEEIQGIYIQHVPPLSAYTILRIGDYSADNPNIPAIFDIANIPFSCSYRVPGADLYYEQLRQQEKMIWETRGTDNEAGVKKILPPIDYTKALYGVKQNLEE